MANREIYLTIDDAPSSHMKKKVDLLLRHQIPTIFFCRGIYMPPHLDQVAYAIEKGFLIGNHSYTHPYFSDISFEEAKEEILKTEEQIEKAYHLAGCKRPHKLFRFPFMDKGKKRGEEHYQRLQDFLKAEKFEKISSPQVDQDIDVSWTFDAREYALFDTKYMKKYGLFKPQDFSKKLERELKNPMDIVLFHDFETTHEVFAPMVEKLIAMNVTFCPLAVNGAKT
jgi:peptidoglycan/xylan/chitin deacetylase (PgdA/CDA1 family)